MKGSLPPCVSSHLALARMLPQEDAQSANRLKSDSIGLPGGKRKITVAQPL
jgi:hypothetical protein